MKWRKILIISIGQCSTAHWMGKSCSCSLELSHFPGWKLWTPPRYFRKSQLQSFKLRFWYLLSQGLDVNTFISARWRTSATAECFPLLVFQIFLYFCTVLYTAKRYVFIEDKYNSLILRWIPISSSYTSLDLFFSPRFQKALPVNLLDPIPGLWWMVYLILARSTL